MPSPVPRLRRVIFLVAWAFVASAATPARADVCVTVDESRDTFAPPERSAALLVLARQFELAGERVVPPGCRDSYVVTHVKFGTRIMITLSGPKGQRDATAMGMDDVPAVYSQMVRSLLRGQPMEAPGVVDRTNVSATQSTPPNRTHSDGVWYARLGYGAHFGDETYGGPSVGFLGYRREGNRFGIDVSFLNFQVQVIRSDLRLLFAAGKFRNDWDVAQARRPPLLLSRGGSKSIHRGRSQLGHGELQSRQHVVGGRRATGRANRRLRNGPLRLDPRFRSGDAGLPFYNLRSTTYTS